ncbi:GNAT family N-acetyltransferase [Vitiosangium sp. GDMCC 1.1324]|uniref:GNAT family N-acetyltransferase n=1 Tax=Vitiosangium sp. (strain GDMCC 1.1324) TaxID=2138576 RepID=UPI000D3C0475|nr:GNAT family N-acetyltransferase [Vitiosangium sp. GDMCC 1.1324]PTL77216.1 GNAT family N-acetyltransferase [Vitiosangium sp. GDMCC 1.1324]
MRIETRELTPELWPAFEKLFGKNGACAGCWCTFWRLEKGERFSEVKGAEAKRRMKALVESGEAQGLLAFVDGAPVGWLALGPRREFKKLDRAPSLKCDDADRVWSLPCFFVHKDWRGQGVASELLRAALEVLKKRGAEVVEAYPMKPSAASGRMPAASVYTGTVPLFLRQGFEVVAERPSGKQRVRRSLTSAPGKTPARRSR